MSPDGRGQRIRVGNVRAIAVIVPAHNEADLLGPCLASIHRALDHPAVRGIRSCVVVTLDSCTDGSDRIAERALRPTDALVAIEARNVGVARSVGVAHALRVLDVDVDGVWIANTDADTVVPSHWLARQVSRARTVDAVAGVVRVADWSSRSLEIRDAFDRGYQGTWLRRHRHVHGANLGVRASAYASVGGFGDHRCSEDHALWNALRAHGHALRASRRVWVTTSARRIGRAPGGFADTLNALEQRTLLGT